MCRIWRLLAVLRSVFHSSLLCTFSCHPSPPTILPSSLASSCNLFLGLLLNLVVPKFIYNTLLGILQGVPLATEPDISLIILPLMRILQRNLKRPYLSVWEMWRHHNMCWKWPPFASRQDWNRRAIFWKVLASTSAVTAWISSVIFAFKATVVRGLFW